MRLAMIGTGYVGLTTGALFADRGNKIVCVDKNQKVINELNQGRVHFFEPGLEDVVKRNCEKGNLTFSMDLENAVEKSEVTFIAVGTPAREDGSADLSYILEAARNIGTV